MKRFLTILIFSILLMGCMVGPRFRTPQIDMPAEFGSGAHPSDSLEELCWWTIFPDSILHRLIMLALENNRSAEIALSRVETARLNLGIARSHLLPGVALNLSGQYGNLSASAIKPENPIQIYSTPLTISWEADIFGVNRRASEKARYELLASEYGLRAVRLSLIAEVAHSYFSLLEYKRSLAIAQSTLATRNTSYNLMLESFNQGTISELELRQAETQRAVVATAVPKYRLAIAETAHALSVLTGQWATDSLTTG
ncbi:MAG: TolC family protein, partial [Rikenellaceae bacterium]|nr:TolC family protein [Rikenellaceae bacterium]MBR6495620.1 TolC family protein [Rikenellaceae bacterium]